jgi:hypothetical protein
MHDALFLFFPNIWLETCENNINCSLSDDFSYTQEADFIYFLIRDEDLFIIFQML